MYDLEFIKYRLRSRDISLADIATDLNVSRSAVTQVLQGRATSARILEAVASRLGVDVDELSAIRAA